MQDHQFALGIAEDKHVAVAKVCFLDGFLQGHGSGCNRIIGMYQVNVSGAGHCGKFMQDHGYCGSFGYPESGSDLVLPAGVFHVHERPSSFFTPSGHCICNKSKVKKSENENPCAEIFVHSLTSSLCADECSGSACPPGTSQLCGE